MVIRCGGQLVHLEPALLVYDLALHDFGKPGRRPSWDSSLACIHFTLLVTCWLTTCGCCLLCSHHRSCQRFACRINGLTHINLTKLDCLDALDTIQLGVEYQVDGQPLLSLPADLSILEAVHVKYDEIPGWKSDISKCRAWDDLPDNARKYIARIEELVGVKCKWIGVGPGRDAIVVQP